MFKKIPILKGKYEAIVDAEDYVWLMQYSWTGKQKKKNCGIYVVRNSRGYVPPKKYRLAKMPQTKAKMAHVVFGKPVPKGMVIDHINHNTLDNRKSNLRLVTEQQNRWNRPSTRNSSSKYKGVSLEKGRGFRVQLWCKGKIYRKRFKCEKEAAKYYNELAREHHGEYAVLNDV